MKNTNTQIDKSDLHRVILSSADQFAEGFSAAGSIELDANFSRVTISGMGGSALHGDILLAYLNDVFLRHPAYDRLQFYQNRTYDLPPESFNDCLNIICSHSGNTEETLSCLHTAIEKNLLCVGISAGGLVEKICKQNNIPHVKLPIPFENFQPRMATGHFVSAIMKILANTGKIPDESMEIIQSVAREIHNDIVSYEGVGKEIAKKLVGKTPIIYASDRFRAIALVWKIKINENSKVPAFWNYFPELNHNEFVGFTNPQASFSVMILRDENDHERNLVRYDATANTLRSRGVDVEILDIVSGHVFRKLFSTIGMCDWISYYLALEYEQDPTPVDMVEDFKKIIG
jgi:glucose/mannose-6-phosphate isomerase